jgi:hypothetical protein
MNAKDLRMGNLVQDYDESNLIFSVDEIAHTEDGYFINGRMEDDVLSIPITEKFLRRKTNFKPLKVGGFGGWFKLENIAILHEKGEFIIHLIRADGSYVYLRDIEFVHSLQNIVFYFTDKELEIKMK